MTDPAALTDDHSPDHWTHAGRRWAAILGDTERIGDDGIRQALAQLEQHLADGCPQDHHRHIGDGMCRHVVREGPSVASGAIEQTVSGASGRGALVRTSGAFHVSNAPVVTTNTVRATLRTLCGQPLPCPDHPQAVLTGVEAEAARRAQTVHLGDRLTREADAAAIAIGRLLSTVLQVHKLRAAPVVGPERCTGGYGRSVDPTCGASVVKHVYVQGLGYGLCLRCWERCRKAERGAA